MKQSPSSTEPLSDARDKHTNRAIAYASRLLGVREYSRKGLSDKILQKGYEQHVVSQAIDFLLENDWLNEDRFCESFVRSRIGRGQGPQRIEYELQRAGISAQKAEMAIEAAEVDWPELCCEVAARKMTAINFDKSLKQRQKVERFLRYRGFPGSQIRTAIMQYQRNMGATTGEYDE